MKRQSVDKKYRNTLKDYGLPQEMLPACRCLSFQAGEIVVQEGFPIPGLGIVLEGHAKVCSTTANGKNLVLSYYISEGMIGELEFMARLDVATATIVAITDFTYLEIPCRGYETQLRENVVFLSKMAEAIAGKLIDSSNNYISAALCTGEERLCSYILQNAHNDMFTDVLTDTSCSVGMSYRHMFRLLGELCSEGILEKRKSGYRIVDREKLAVRSAAAYKRRVLHDSE